MKMKIGIGLAALSALAAKGKDFNREELNAMLDKLAASPEPMQRCGPTAMCYKMAMPERKSFDYLCRKCGMRTHYPENYEGLGEELAFYRDGAAKLRGIGAGDRVGRIGALPALHYAESAGHSNLGSDYFRAEAHGGQQMVA